MRQSRYHFKFEDLKVYNKAIEFGEMVHHLAQKFPKEERFELISQFKRASDSIALNIAEGANRTDRQFYNYLSNAWRSGEECIAIATKDRFRDYISFEEDEKIRGSITEISKMIAGLRMSIGKRIDNK